MQSHRKRGVASWVTPLIAIATLLLTSGCVSFTHQNSTIEELMVTKQLDVAITALEKKRTAKRDRALFLMDKGLLLRMQGNLEASNASLEEAKQLSDKLEAISIREQAAATTINDGMRSYLPPLFERAMIHCIKGVNFLEMSQKESARVEVMQLIELLKKDEAVHFPFAHYFSGLVFEANSEYDSAMISYRKAYNAYRENRQSIPLPLKKDLLRLTAYLGLTEEHTTFQSKFSISDWPKQSELRNKANVIAIVFNGLIPRMHSQEISAQSPKDGQLHRISVPFFEKRQPDLRQMTLISGGNKANTELVGHLDHQANAALEDAMPGIIARTIARVSLKNNMVDNTRKEAPLLGAVLNVVTFLTETADTRGWITLPQQMLVARLYLDPGEHRIMLDKDEGTIADVNLKKGESHFISTHWPHSYATSRRP